MQAVIAEKWANRLHRGEWEKRGERKGLFSVMSLDWTKEECEEATNDLKRAIFEILGDISEAKVLDLGCGIGRLSGDLAARAKEVRAFDISRSMLKRIVKNVTQENVSFTQAASLAIPYPSESFDCIFVVTVLNHITQDEDFRRSLKEMERVLKPGGKLFICEHMESERRELSQFTILRTFQEYEGFLNSSFSLVNDQEHLCVRDSYNLSLWQKN